MGMVEFFIQFARASAEGNDLPASTLEFVLKVQPAIRGMKRRWVELRRPGAATADCPSQKPYPRVAMVQSGRNWRGDALRRRPPLLRRSSRGCLLFHAGGAVNRR